MCGVPLLSHPFKPGCDMSVCEDIVCLNNVSAPMALCAYGSKCMALCVCGRYVYITYLCL